MTDSLFCKVLFQDPIMKIHRNLKTKEEESDTPSLKADSNNLTAFL